MPSAVIYPDRVYVRLTLALVAALTVFRLWFCTSFELVGDEAYYWLWSKHLDMSYFSKGPGVAWTIALGTRLFGDTALGVRFWSVVLGAGTSLGMFWLARTLFSARAGFWTVVIGNLTPLFLAGSVLMTIDPLSVFFWIAAALAFWKAKDDGFEYWALAGLFIGLGMLCKYTNVAEIPSFALFCLWSPAYRRRLREPGFWIMLAVALACLAPPILWNQQRGWITVKHLADRGDLDQPWRFMPGEFLEFVGNQIGVLSPIVFAALVVALICRQDIRDRFPDAWRFLLALFVPLLVFYAALSFNGADQANWTAPALASVLPLVAAVWIDLVARSPKARYAARAGVWLSVALVFAFHVLVWIRLPMERDCLRRIRGSADLARQVADLQQTKAGTFLIAANYQTASLLSFYEPQRPQTFLPHTREIKNQFAFWPTYGPKQAGCDALFINNRREIPAVLTREFRSVSLLAEPYSRYHGYPERQYFVYWCREFQGVDEARPGG